MRANLYKDKIVKLLRDTHFLSIARIHESVPEADYSTIYRNIKQLLDDKKIKEVLIGNKVIVYELVYGNEHDHFVCDDCGDVAEIEVPERKSAFHYLSLI